MKEITKPQNSDAEDKHVERVRRICLALPETWEKISHGEPTFFVKKRVFATCSINHHNDGHVAVVIPAAIGIQEMLQTWITQTAGRSNTVQVICWDRGRPARKRAAGAQCFLEVNLIFALRAHCGRDARGPSRSLDRRS